MKIEGLPAQSGCRLCPHRCAPSSGGFGLCKVRRPDGSSPLGSTDAQYGRITALALDPIEKKPLYRWRPGSRILSVGFAGCNLRCPFCQNWHISQDAAAPSRAITPAELVAEAETCEQIAYTYSEPLVHFEFVRDAMALARKRGVANVLVTNGCVNAELADEILGLTDAANIDLKCFSAETYAKVLGGDLDAVKNFIATALEKGVHIELTTLVVPGLNDGEAEIDAAADFVASLEPPRALPLVELSRSVPWHFSAYHPDWKWDAPATEPAALVALARRAKARIAAAGKAAEVFVGNIAAPPEFRPQ